MAKPLCQPGATCPDGSVRLGKPRSIDNDDGTFMITMPMAYHPDGPASPPKLITFDQASELARREFDAAQREIQDEREREARQRSDPPPPPWIARNRRVARYLVLAGLVLAIVSLALILAELWFVPGGTP